MKIYELRVEVLGEGVWRRLEVPAEMTLAGLHLTLQRAMGWTNSGLYAFETPDARYGVLNHEDEWMRDPRATDVRVRRIGELAARARHIDYIYEGARSWRHAIVVEGAADATPGERYPRVIGGEGVSVMEALEPGAWRQPSPGELPTFDDIQRQASADAGFDSIARLLVPLGSAPLLPEVASPPSPTPPAPRRLAAPPHVIRPPELMAACMSRLGGAHPEQGLEAFVADVAEHHLFGVHDMFTRKVVEDMLRQELGPPPPPPALEPEPEPAVELDAAPVDAPLAEARAEQLPVDARPVDAPSAEEPSVEVSVAVEEPAAHEEPVTGAVASGEAPRASEADELEPIESAGLQPVDDLVAQEGSSLADMEELSSHGPGEGAQLELGEVGGEGLGALEDLEATSRMEAAAEVEELSAWEEESWSLSEPGGPASLDEVGELSEERDALGELPSWGAEGEGEAPRLWDASLDELGAMSASGFEASEHDAPHAGAFEPATEGAREAFEPVRAEGEVVGFEVEPGLKALPRSRRLLDCLERLPARWLDVIAAGVEVEEPRRAARGRAVAGCLVRVEVLSELVAAELSVEAAELARELAAQEGARGVSWCVDGSHVDDELDWFTFDHDGALGQLRRCGLVFVGVSGALAELEVVVPVELRRPLQLVLR